MNSYYWTLKKRSILQGTQTALLVLIFLSGSMTASAGQPAEYDVERPVYAVEFISYRTSQPNITYLEAFCQIPTNEFIFIKSKDGFFASYELTITLYDITGYEAAKASLVDSVEVKSFKDIESSKTRLFNSLWLLACAG